MKTEVGVQFRNLRDASFWEQRFQDRAAVNFNFVARRSCESLLARRPWLLQVQSQERVAESDPMGLSPLEWPGVEYLAPSTSLSSLHRAESRQERVKRVRSYAPRLGLLK